MLLPDWSGKKLEYNDQHTFNHVWAGFSDDVETKKMTRESFMIWDLAIGI